MTVAHLPVSLVEALNTAVKNNVIRIAYSGGLDSRFLAFCSKLAGLDVQLLHISGPHVAPEETKEALTLAAAMGLSVRTIEINPLDCLDISSLGNDRCYACKRLLFRTLLDLDPAFPLCDGSNASDADLYRPGRRAIQELGIISPLALAGLTKSDIRQWSAKLGLPHPEQRARPCLLTRFPYGTAISREELRVIAQAEKFVAEHPVGRCLAFRLRMPAPGRPELHVEATDAQNVTQEQLDILARELKRTIPELTRLRVLRLPTLSGFYDLRSQESR